MRALVLAVALTAFGGTLGCTTYKDQLARGERAFEQNDNDRSIALLRDIENDFQRLSPTEQADYAYVRGMADYNVGYKADARHWLAVARGVEEATPGALATERRTKVATVLNELNTIVHQEGSTANLVNARKEDPAPAAKPDAESAPKAAKPAKKPQPAEPTPVEDDTAPDAPAAKPAPAKKK